MTVAPKFTKEYLLKLKEILDQELKEQNINLVQLYMWQGNNEPCWVFKVTQVNFISALNNPEQTFIEEIKSERVLISTESSIGIAVSDKTKIFLNGRLISIYKDLCNSIA